jgi:hypothetical protein
VDKFIQFDNVSSIQIIFHPFEQFVICLDEFYHNIYGIIAVASCTCSGPQYLECLV